MRALSKMLDTSTDKKGDGVRVVWMQGKNESGAVRKKAKSQQGAYLWAGPRQTDQ